jgi:DNA-binding transcriptional LysR family regulator
MLPPRGMVLSTSPTFIVYEQLAKGELIPVLNGYGLRVINAYAICPQTRYLSQRVRTFVDFLIERFEGTPYWDNLDD